MLAQDGTLVSHVGGKVEIDCKYFDDKEWIGEIKYDGSRYVLQWDEEGKVFLTSRNVSVKDNLPTDKTENLRGYLYDDCKELAGITIDGEILIQHKNENGDWVFLKGNGSSEVNKIMLSAPEKAKERLADSNIKLIYVVYDVLRALDQDVTDKGVIARKRILEDVMCVLDKHLGDMAKKHMKLAPVFHPATKKQFQEIISTGGEGMMLKRIESNYQQGEHSKDWLKVKNCQTYDGVVMGMNMGTGKYENTMGALVIGQFFEVTKNTDKEFYETFAESLVEEGKLFVVGKEVLFWQSGGRLFVLKEVCTISGMTDEQRNNYWEDFKGRITRTEAYKDGSKVRFFQGKIAENAWCVEFLAQEKTKSRYRHPRFIQNREDKNLQDCLFSL